MAEKHVESCLNSVEGKVKTIGHFRITFGLFFKASLGAHPFIWKLVLIHMQMKTNFHMKRWAPGLALKKRPKVIRKWPIGQAMKLLIMFLFSIYGLKPFK